MLLHLLLHSLKHDFYSVSQVFLSLALLNGIHDPGRSHSILGGGIFEKLRKFVKQKYTHHSTSPMVLYKTAKTFGSFFVRGVVYLL